VCLNRSENVLCCHRRNSKLLISFIIKLIILNEKCTELDDDITVFSRAAV